MITGLPSAGLSRSATRRATMSGETPAAYGRMTRMGRSGKPACPHEIEGIRSATATSSALLRFMEISSRLFIVRLQPGDKAQGSFLVAEDPGGERARVARRGAALVDQGEELEERPVERLRVLDVDGMAGARQHHQAGVADAALHEERGLEARVVLVARDDERRDFDLLHVVDQLVERRPAHLHAAHGERLALRRVLGELAGELGPAARVLVLELHARRAEGVLGRGFAPVAEEGSGRRFALGPELVFLLRLGAVAAAGDYQRARTVRVRNAEVQRGESAHREPDHVRALDAEMVEHRESVVARMSLRIALAVLRDVRGREPARSIGDAAEIAR